MDVMTVLEYPLFLILIPFLLTVFIYFIMKFLSIHPWRKIHITAQTSAFFYVVGVIVLVEVLYDIFILSYVLILFIVFLAFHITLQWKKDVQISLKKAIVLMLRMSFLLFLFAYSVLVVLYIIQYFA